MRWLLFILLTLPCATCGQKGPLILPEPDPASAQAAMTHSATAAIGAF